MEGHSGSGKTAIIQHIAIKYKNEGWNVKPLHDAQGLIDTYYRRKKFQKKTLFILNDPFGQESFDEILYNLWVTNMDAMEHCLGRVKLLMSCRTSILLDYRLKKLLKKSIIVKIDSDEFQLTINEKRSIFNRHKGNKELSFKEGEIFKIGPYFPLLCKLYFSNNEYQQCGIRFFEEPVEIFKDEIEKYRNTNPVKYCALVLVVLFDNDLRVNDLTRSKLSLQKYKHALDLFGLGELAPYKIGDTLELMKGFFVKKIDDSYQFYHDFVMEITTYMFGKDYPSDVIECADIGFLRRRVRLKTCEGQNDPFTIYLNDTSYINQLGERLFNGILGIDFLEVVLNPCLKNEKVSKAFIGRIDNDPEKLPRFLEMKTIEAEKQKTDQTINNLLLSDVTFLGLEKQFSPLFALITFCHTKVSLHCLQILQKIKPNFDCSSLFPAVCCNGSKDLLQLFSKNIDKFSAEKWGSLFPVHIASVFHNYEILRELLKVKDNVNKRTYDEDRWTPLILAAANETDEIKDMQKQTLALLLDSGADINAYSKTGITPVSIACENGNEKIVEYLLKHGSIINYINTKDETSPLYKACQEGQDSIIKLLLTYGAEINYCQEGASLLYRACQKGHDRTVQYLLTYGADINLRTEKGISPLYVALQEGHDHIVQLLFKRGADINLCDEEGVSLLHKACQKGHNSTVQHLLNNEAEINLRTKTGISPLYIACQEGNDSTIQILLSKQANINLCTENNESPLYVACKNGHYSTVKLLLENKSLGNNADIDLCREDGTSPLFIASCNGYEKIVRILLNNGANKNKCNKDNESPLFSAISCGHDRIAKLLLDHNADISLCTTNSESPLHIACQNGNENIVPILLGKGSCVDSFNNDRDTPLHIACIKGNENIVRILLKNGADINFCKERGKSPLHKAISHGHYTVVKLLLSNGADNNLCLSDRESPLYTACDYGQENIVNLLLINKANVNICKKNGESPLHAATAYGHYPIVETLLQNGANINACQRDGESPLYKACENGHDGIVKLLLSHGANANLCKENGKTALHAATAYGHKTIVETLLNNAINACKKDGESALNKSCENTT